MKQSILLLCMVVLGLGVTASAQNGRVPTFGGYPATVQRATARSIDFRRSDRGARSFRTRLTEALREGVNFAGRYVVAGWGCGTGCVSAAIIDARTGIVYFPEPIGGIATGIVDGDYVDEPVKFKKNSRLLVISGIPESQFDNRPELPAGDYYYEWKNNRLRLIRSIPYPKN